MQQPGRHSTCQLCPRQCTPREGKKSEPRVGGGETEETETSLGAGIARVAGKAVERQRLTQPSPCNQRMVSAAPMARAPASRTHTCIRATSPTACSSGLGGGRSGLALGGLCVHPGAQ